jgi:T-complex protein 1 subunit theta
LVVVVVCVLGGCIDGAKVGDATNLVVILAGDLLAQAEALLRMGLHTADVVAGFEKAWKKADELLESTCAKRRNGCGE